MKSFSATPRTSTADLTAFFRARAVERMALSNNRPYLVAIVESYVAQQRAWRAGDGTTAHLLDVALNATKNRRRRALHARRRAQRASAGR